MKHNSSPTNIILDCVAAVGQASLPGRVAGIPACQPPHWMPGLPQPFSSIKRLARIAIALATVLAVICPAPIHADSATPGHTDPSSDATYLSPSAIAAAPDGKTLYIGCATANRILVFDAEQQRIARSISVPASPLGLALSRDGSHLYVTCAAPVSTICVLDAATGRQIAAISAGHTAMAPVLSADEKTLYVCNRFNNEIAVIDLRERKTVATIPVPREPVAAALTRDEKHLLVANHLHAGRADADFVAATVTVIDVTARRVIKQIALPNGSGLLRDIQVSPDGKYACVTHLLSRFHLPTTQIERGWINSNALSLIDLAELKLINTVLLDNIDSGAANPWAAAWTHNGESVVITHAGTHELSVVDLPALLSKLAKLPAQLTPGQPAQYISASRTAADVPNDLSFLVDLRRRIKLPDKGPRAVALVGNTAYVANYFSDSLSIVDLSSKRPNVSSVALGPDMPLSEIRRGELHFNDATLCFQGWQSCASCHSSDARVDALNWDNLNDGIGNPKNVKSLLLAHETPPAMALGVRPNAEAGVRAGLRHILFTVQPEEVPNALDAYLKSLKPIPSPYLVDGKLSPAAERGRIIFNDERVGCAECHRPGLFTNLKKHHVGTRGKFDKPDDRFDTPTLVELWRTAPYLHDGSAATLREVPTSRNAGDDHGATSHLSAEQIDDLVAYLLSL